jgi:transcriptional regulator with XRE-family HTH domain
MDTAPRRTELAHFLRARRERLSPAEGGFLGTGRRRTPGLRREEVAFMVGVSTSWYTWLEQGRAITVSAPVLERLAQVLRLTAQERAHLFILAREEVPVTFAAAETLTIDAATQQVLDVVSPAPAYVVNARWQVVAWNRIACQVFVDFATLSEPERNLLRLLFTNPIVRERYEQWECVAERMLALFRVSTTRSIGERWYTDLIEELWSASREFQQWWPKHDIADSPREVKALNHPLVGRLLFSPNPLQIANAPDCWMLVHTPVPGTGTLARLEQLLLLHSTGDAGAGLAPPEI